MASAPAFKTRYERAQIFLQSTVSRSVATPRSSLRRDALNVLQQRELEHASQSIARETCLMPRAVMDGTPISGIYRRSIVLASGRFAMLDDGLGFSLVPWRPIVEQHLGRPVSAVIRGEHVSWQIARSRAIGLG